MDQPNIEGARKAARVILEAARAAFSADMGRALFHETAFAALTHSVFDPETAQPILELARQGDREARVAVKQAIASFVALDEPVPPTLKEYLLEFILTPNDTARPGKSPHDNYARDQWIALAVGAAMAYGVNRTRNREQTATPSACSIVRDVLRDDLGFHIDVTRIEQISKGVS